MTYFKSWPQSLIKIIDIVTDRTNPVFCSICIFATTHVGGEKHWAIKPCHFSHSSDLAKDKNTICMRNIRICNTVFCSSYDQNIPAAAAILIIMTHSHFSVKPNEPTPTAAVNQYKLVIW